MGQKKIWIKADGNENIATGHIRRCMTIAKELKERGAEPLFVVADERSANLLIGISDAENTSFDSMILHTDYANPMEDLPIFEGLFEEDAPDFIFVDSYSVTPEYFAALSEVIARSGKNIKVGYIDDFGRADYKVDLIINYDIVYPEGLYTAEKQLLGAGYAPLRKEFGKVQASINEKAKRVLLSTGGTDTCHVISSILSEVYENDSPYRKTLDNIGICFEIIVGAFFEPQYKRQLKEFEDKYKGVTLHESVADMAGLMLKCDLAVSAGGSTLYELCAVGVPTVVFSMADNQMEFVKSFDKAGAVKYAGDARDDRRLVQKMITWGTAAYDNPGFRKRMSDKARSIVDGKGTSRIADAIFGLME